MNQNSFILTDNHRRSLSSTLIVVEQMLVEIKNLMIMPGQTCCTELNKDINLLIVEQNIKVIEDALSQICLLKDKYKTDKTVLSLQRVVDAKKTKIWETLHNSKSKRIKGFGEFPQKAVKEYDNDIDKLMAIAEKIKIK
jgi:hypothetical protein